MSQGKEANIILFKEWELEKHTIVYHCDQLEFQESRETFCVSLSKDKRHLRFILEDSYLICLEYLFLFPFQDLKKR